MKKSLVLVALLLSSALVQANPPSKESIEKLLVVTEVEKTLDAMKGQVEGSMKSGMDQAMQGKAMTPEEQEKAAAVQAKVAEVLAEELSWPKIKELYFQIYTETFTQEEIDGLIAFYESPTGKAFVAKMPVITQKSMQLMQERMGPVMQKVQEAVRSVEPSKP